MKTAVIRQKFIDFFTKKGHTFVPGAPVVQHDNPALLFINAGMNPFTNIFLGNEAPKALRVANSQLCLRVAGKHNDLEEVGVDTYHHTLFEMLGNWSFGDYFKKEAIAYAWELLTEVYKLPKERLYVTVFEGDKEDGLSSDQEAYELWKAYLPKERILFANKKDNFWEMGATGPCGPCTEIHVDLRTEKEQKAVAGHTLVNADHPHVIEIWNLVFIQYHRQANGQLKPLPKCHVDTGMGLERLAMVLQGKKATYDTDAFQPFIQALAKAANTTYGKNRTHDIALRVAADHIRAISLAITDGALPSNQQAGYVVRRLLRRAVRYGYQHLGFTQPFLHQLVPILVESMGAAYPALAKQQKLIEKVIYQEELNFLRTLSQGLRQFHHFRSHTQNNILDGKAAFQLYDTYGFPLDLTILIAKEEGMKVDIEAFNEEMEAQKKRSKQAAEKEVGDWQMVQGHERHTTFVGYDALESVSQLIAYRQLHKHGKTSYQLVLDKTPFYAQGGGQVGDTGFLYIEEEKIAVLDTRKEEGVIIHYTNRLPNNLNAPIKAVIDKERRRLTANNHTATHLLEGALRRILGTHITQRGSYLDSERLRFDFTHPQKLTQAQIYEIEAVVNEKIRANILQEEVRNIPFQEAKEKGALTLIGEQYGDTVRMITFDPNYSIALCGGTHVPATGQIGFFKIIAETSIAAGIRRIEAVTAKAAEEWIRHTQEKLITIETLLKNPQDVVHAVKSLQASYKKEQKKSAKYIQKELQHAQKSLKAQLIQVNDIHLGIAHIEISAVEDLRKVMMPLTRAYNRLILVITTLIEGKAYIAIMVSEELADQHNAQQLLAQLSPYIQGKGGGNATFAMAKGDHSEGLQQARNHASRLLK